jgi:phytoene/squalene synthetase
VDVETIAARAQTENFPVASVLFPRELRPHLRAVYGFCRLVDVLGDELDGDRLAALDELEREVEACYAGEPEWPVLRQLQPTIRAFDLPREPFLRLIECNRRDQRIHEYETWAQLEEYCDHSADPVGRLVLGRIYLPAEDRRRFGVTVLDRRNEPLRQLLVFETERARKLLSGGRVLQERLGGRMGRAVNLFSRGGLAALDALEQAGFDVFDRRPRPSRARLAREAVAVLVR